MISLLLLLVLVALGFLIFQNAGWSNGLQNIFSRAKQDLHRDEEDLRREIDRLKEKRDCCKTC